MAAVLPNGCRRLYLEPGKLLRTPNAVNINKPSEGMSRATVTELMGTDTAKGLFYWIDNPCRSETLTSMDGNSCEILYYTDLKQRDDKITDDELTPLVVKTGKLIGSGYPLLDRKVPPKPVYRR